MKKLFPITIILLSLTSCAPIFYYQSYKIEPVNNVTKSSNPLVYEDENLIVEYNFWGEGGNVEFLLYNKSDKNIYVNLKESFFIRNGIAFDYFLDREF